MENIQIKKERGRPRFYTEEEKKRNKTNYMLNKPWYCEVCNNGKNYSLAGKTCHLKTKKHMMNNFEKGNPGLKIVYLS